MKNAVISISGGRDSTCLLLKLLEDGYNVKAYSFQYNQKHQIELKKAKKNIKFLQSKGFQITHQIIDLTDIFSDSNSTLKNGGEKIPEGNYNVSNMKNTVVENRNIIFSSIIYGKALSWANKINDDVKITLGVHSGDHCIYKDCRPESINMSKELFKISNWGSERVDYIAPFVYINKAEVLEQGINAMKNIGFDNNTIKKILKNTHTCYNPNSKGESCGKCGSCNERIDAFNKNKIKDPIKYSEF